MVTRIRPVSLSFLALALLMLGAPTFAQPGRQSPADAEVEKHKKEIDDNARTPSSQDKRETAIRALGRLNTPAAVDALIPLLGDPFEHIRELTILVLAGGDPVRHYPGVRDATALARLVDAGLAHDNPIARKNACEAIARLGQNPAIRGKVDDMIARLGRERDESVKVAIVGALARIGNATPKVVDELDKLVKRGRGAEKPAAIIALARLQKFEMLDTTRLIRDRDPAIKAATLDACAMVNQKLAETIDEVAKDRRADDMAKIAAIEALVPLHATNADKALEFAAQFVTDAGSWRARATAMDALVHMWDKRAIPLLIARLEAETGRLKLDAFLRLRFLTAREAGMDPAPWKTWWNAQGANFQLRQKPEPGPLGYDFTSTDFGNERASAAFFNIPVVTKSLYFIFDASGSMGNPATNRPGSPRKIEYAAAKARETLDNLPDDARYNLVLYRYFSAYPPRTALEVAFPDRPLRDNETPPLVPVNRRTTQRVEDFIRSIQIGGWGDYWGTINAAMQNPDVDTVFFLTDGKPTRGEYIRTDEFLAALKERNRFRRLVVNTVVTTGGVGGDADFMKKLAIATGGLFVQVDFSKEDQ